VNLDRRTLAHVARLARLRLETAEAESFSQDLTKILTYFAVLDEWTPRATLAPPCQEGGAFDRLRADSAEVTLTRAEALSGAPETEGGEFTLPAVVRRDPRAPAASPEPEEGS
jgi:aspartyl-tRNA(Asn)/glutamyl-tRNA(Gln) amidotransferase subunit C